MSRDQGMDLELAVPSEDPTKQKKTSKDEEEQVKKPEGNGKDGVKGDGGGNKDDEMSDEDLQLKNELEMLVERLKESDTDLYKPALESLRTLIKTSTSSMTSVPKPLKFLRPFYTELIDIREQWAADSNNDKLAAQRSLLSSIISVLAMTYSDNGNRDTLHYRLISGSEESPGDWGHEYVRHLATELGEEYSSVLAGEAAASTDGEEASTKRTLKSRDQLLTLALELVPFFLQHNAEADAVDLLLELESIEKLDTEGFLDGDKGKDVFQRVCQYMVNCVPLLVPPDDRAFLRTAAAIYAKHERYPEALALAIRLRDRQLVRNYFEAPKNMTMRKQLAFVLGRAQIPTSWVHRAADAAADEEMEDDSSSPVPTLPEDLLECLGNVKRSDFFQSFAKELDVVDPKSLEDVYKSHLEHTRIASNIDSAKANLAGTFVNSFVNAGFSNDQLVVDVEEGKSFIYKNKNQGMMAATASIGMSMLWNTDMGVSVVDKYTYSSEEHIKAGAFLAIGMLHSGIRPEFDVAYALLEEHVDNPSMPLKIAAMNGIALGCAATERQEIAAKLLPYVDDASWQVAAMAALSLGFVFAGSGDADIATSIVQALMERDGEEGAPSKYSRFLALGLALIYLGQQDACEATLELLKTLEKSIGREAEILVEMCAYAGTGNVLKIQRLLHICAEQKSSEESSDDAAAAEKDDSNKEDDDKRAVHQSFAVLGLAIIAMGEEVGEQMVLRNLGHLMAYGNEDIRAAVPIALGLLSASNPQLPVMDSLSKYSHIEDMRVAQSAVAALGLIGAGTNNARIAQLLRGLSTYYAKLPDTLFVVRIAQGLNSMGKGLIGLSPLIHDGTTLHYPSICGLLATAVSMLNFEDFILGTDPWHLFWLSTAMHPNSLHILDESMEEKKIDIRVGQKTHYTLGHGNLGITGAVTNSAPVRVGVNERAVLSNAEYIPYTPALENIVIVRKNEGYDAED